MAMNWKLLSIISALSFSGQVALAQDAVTPAPTSAPPTSPASALQQTVTKTSPPQAEASSVESFFQINCPQRNSQSSLRMQPAIVPIGTPREKSAAGGMSRAVWHVLDNMGVPMFGGFDPCIDPSISGSYAETAPKLPRERKLDTDLQRGVTAASSPSRLPDPSSAPCPAQKLPTSELEGVDLPALR